MNESHRAPFVPPASGGRSFLGKVFLGSHGLRSGWRLLIFVVLGILLLLAAQLLVGVFHRPSRATVGSLDEKFLLLNEGILAAVVFIAALIMGRIEGRGFAAYGLPWAKAFGSRFWEGAVWGFVAISALVRALAEVHTFSLSSVELGRSQALAHGLLWAAAFIVVGFFEEFLFRGYALATLTEGIGFWPAAILLSAAFGGIHLGNSGETWIGAALAGFIGLFFCLTLRRTGSLWFAIGLHAAWDWGETFFYGVPDSGQVASHHLFSSISYGPPWLSGGTAGPEGSVLALGVIAVLWVLVERRFRRKHFPSEQAGGL